MYKKRILKMTASLILMSFIICLFNFMFVPPMNDHWANKDRKRYESIIDTVFIGDSLGMYSIQPSLYDEKMGKISYNGCTACQDLSDSYFLLNDYINSFPQLKEVFLMLDYFNFNPDLDYGASSKLILFNRIKLPAVKIKYFCKSFSIDDWYNILIKKALYKTDFQEVVKNIETKSSSQYRNYGKLTGEEIFYFDKGYVCTYMTNQNKSDQAYDAAQINAESLEYFKKIIELCQENDISLSIVHSPMTANRITSLKNYSELYLSLKSVCNSFDIAYYDYNYPSKNIALDYVYDFKDNTHLNYFGSCKFMNEFCQDISGDKQS